MKPYSMDLRERVVEAVDEGKQTKWEISLRFQVSPAWIRRLLQRRRETGSIEPKSRDYTTSGKVDDVLRQRFMDLVKETPDATLAELKERAPTSLSLSTVSRTLRKLGLTLKKSRSMPASSNAPMCSKSVWNFSKR
jgi:transposase